MKLSRKNKQLGNVPNTRLEVVDMVVLTHCRVIHVMTYKFHGGKRGWKVEELGDASNGTGGTCGHNKTIWGKRSG